MRGATKGLPYVFHLWGDFNPRSPCGERRIPLRNLTRLLWHFNPRSPCGERRHVHSHSCPQLRFQSTLPMRGATGKGFKSIRLCQISIHAPHAGSDKFSPAEMHILGISIHAPHAGSDRNGVGFTVDGGDFNPRSPCGERPLLERRGAVLQLFQSTLPMRGATFVVSDLFFYVLISIHAPHAGSDSKRS